MRTKYKTDEPAPKKPPTLYSRSQSYARGVREHEDGYAADQERISRDWLAGYLACMRDVRRIYLRKGGGVATDMHEFLKPRRSF